MTESNATQVILTDDGIKIIKAQDTADNATGGVTNLNDPNLMNVIEKQTQASQYAGLTSQYNVVLARAKEANVSTTALTTAYTNLNTFMGSVLADTTVASDVDRDTYKRLTDAYNTALSNVQTALNNSFNTDISNMQSSVSVASQVASSAVIVASQAATTGDNASHVASQAYSAATVAQSAGNNATSVANNASQAASGAVIAGSQATSVANQAFSQAQSAVDYANSEIAIQSTAIGKAQSVASDAVSKAESTASEFGPVKQNADSALASALNAQSDASDAVKQASTAAADSKDAKQIAGAVSQSYKTLTDGSTMTIAELESGLAVKLTKTDLDGYATQTWTQNQINTTADGINATISSVKDTIDGHDTSINELKADSSGFKAQFTKVNGTLDKHTTDIGTLQASSKEFSSTITTVQTQIQDSAVGINLAFGTNQEYSMGYGIPTTTWKDGYAYENLPTTVSKGEILPQNPHTFYYTLIQGTTYTQTIWFETDATVKDLSAAQITWYTSAGHDGQPATLISLGESKYKIYSTYMWPGKSDNNVRLFDIFSLNYAFDLSTGTYLKFGKLKLEKGSLSTDWCLNSADTATQSQITQLSHDINLRVTKGDLIDQINIQAGNTLISSSGQLTLSGKSVFLDSVNPVIMKSANIANLAVGTAQIGNGAITNAKIGKLAVGTAQIANAAITDAKIDNISANHLTAGTIDFNTITGKNINASNITTGTMSTDRLNVGKLSALSADLGDVTTGSLKGVDIVAKTFSTPNGSFTTDSNGAITAKNMTLIGGTLTSPTINASTINGSTINGGTLNMQTDGLINSPYNGIEQSADNFYHPWKLNTGQLTIGQGYITSVSSGTRSINGIPKQFNHVQGTLSASYLKFTNDYGARTYIDADMFTYSNQTNDTAMVTISAGGVGINMGTMSAPALTISNGYIDASSSSSYGVFGAITLGYSPHTINSDSSLFFESGHGSGNPGINIWAKGFHSLSSRLSTKRQVRLLDDEHSNSLLLGADTATFQYNQDTNADNPNEGVIIDDVNTAKQYSLPDELMTRDGKAPTDLMSFIARVISQNKYQARLIEDLQIRLRKVEINNG